MSAPIPPQGAAASNEAAFKQLVKRVRALESSQTVRIGPDHVITVVDGKPVLIGPGDASLDVGTEPVETVVTDLTRGYVTPHELESAVKGAPTKTSAKVNSAAAFAAQKWQEAVDTVNGLVAGIRGIDLPDLLTNFVTGDIPVAVGDQSDTIAKISAAVALLQQESSEGAANGTSVFVDFSTAADSPTLPTEFTVTSSSPGPGPGSGSLIVAGGKITWDRGSGNRDSTFVYNAAKAQTDYQAVAGVFSSTPGKRTNAVGVAYFTRNVLRLRVNDADDTAVEVAFGPEGFRFGYWDTGVWTEWTGISHNFRSSAIYSLAAGTAGGLRIYQVLCNSDVLLTWPEVGTASQLGSDYRGGGGGVRVNGHDNQFGIDTTQLLPGKLSAFAFADNAPADVPGVAARFYRASTSGSSHGTTASLDAGLFDTVDYQSDVFQVVPNAAFVLQVNKRGQFLINLRILASSSDSAYATLGINGTSGPRKGAHFGGASFAASWQVWLEADDYIIPGVQQGSTRSFVGDASGGETYLEIIKIA